MENANLNRYCQTPLMVAALVVGYICACLPQIDTLAPIPHLAALAYLYLYWRYRRNWSPGITRLVKLLTCLLCGYLTWRHFGLINGIDPGTTLLSVAVIMKFSELKKFRDYFVILLINLYILNTNFLYSFNYFLTLYVVLGNLLVYYLMVICSSGWRIEPIPGTRQGQKLMNVATQIPGWLKENLAHLRKSGQLRYARGLALWIMSVALPLSAIIFFAYPRMQLNLFNLQKSTARALTGFSPYMEPGRFTELINDNRLAFRAKFIGAIPGPEELYWRALTLEQYAGGRWNTARTVRPFLPGHTIKPPRGQSGPAGSERSNLYRYELILPDHRSNWLFSLDHPIKILDTTVFMFLDGKGQLSTSKAPEQVVSYSLQSQTALLNRASRNEAEFNLRLPDFEAPRTRALAAQWRGNAREKLERAIAWFKAQNFEYSLSVADMRTNTIDRFLFEERRGFCEFFASSFAVLMRTAGVPARVVIGYQGGQYSDAGSTVRVYQHAAHAWTEVLLPVQGSPGKLYWHRVDPTVLAEPRRLLESAPDLLRQDEGGGLELLDFDDYQWSRWTRDFIFELGFAWDRWILSYSGAEQQRLLESLRANNRLWLNILLILSVAVLISILLFRYGSKWLSRPTDPLMRLFEDFRHRAQALGADLAPCHGCQTIADRTIAHLRRQAEKNTGRGKEDKRLIGAIAQFSALWQRARYRHNFAVRDGQADPGTLVHLRQFLGQIRRTA